MLKVHSGHRYRPHRTVRLRLNTQVREKEGRVRPFSVFEPHNREQTYASGIPFCSAYCPERTHKYTFYPIKMQEISTKTSFMDNYSFAPPCRQHTPSAFLPVFCLLLLSPASVFCFHLPPAVSLSPPAVSLPPSACRRLPPMRPCYMPPHRSAQAPPSEPRRTFPTGPRRTSPAGPRQTSLPAATDSPPRPRRTSLPGRDGQKKCDPKVALESFQISVKQIFTNSISIPPR